MRVKMHPVLGILVCTDGHVMVPQSGTNKAHWTYGSPDSHGYLGVKINGKRYRVHRLVAETFLDNPEGLPTVDHYPDRTPSNNAVTNLRWADYKMQSDNRGIVDASIEKYGVRKCEDPTSYYRELRKRNPEYAKRQKALIKEWMRKRRAAIKAGKFSP